MKYKNKEWLEDQYINQKKSANDISKLLRCSDTTIGKYLRIHKIPVREKPDPIEEKYRCRGWLFIQYIIMKKDMCTIAKEVNRHGDTISFWIKKFNILIRKAKHEDYIKSGYILAYNPEHPNHKGRYVPKHRLVMEAFLKQYIDPKEVVHHVDGNKLNNRLANLMLFKNDSEHKKYHWKIGTYKNNPIFGRVAS